jgi:hypothetical protein
MPIKTPVTGTTQEGVDLPPVRSLEGKRARLRRYFPNPMSNLQSGLRVLQMALNRSVPPVTAGHWSRTISTRWNELSENHGLVGKSGISALAKKSSSRRPRLLHQFLGHE